MNAYTCLAPAKVNLCLHVTGRRNDGYHTLQSLVAFADVSDHLTLTPAPTYTLSVTGRFSNAIPAGADNLITRAINDVAISQNRSADFSLHLEKNLPVGAGIGGGSADAAATLRLIQNAWGLPDRLIRDTAPTLGADVPVCLSPSTQIMRGIGDTISTAPIFPPLPAVLVWPDAFCDTRNVFHQLKGAFGESMPPLPEGEWTLNTVIEYLARCRNDLEKPAIALLPVIQTALDALKLQNGSRITRMSGSGSTCFALFHTIAQAEAAARAIQKKYPAWWVHAGYINP